MYNFPCVKQKLNSIRGKKKKKKTSDKTFVQPLLGTKQKADKQSDYE